MEEGLTDVQTVDDKLEDPELQCVPVTDELEEEEREGEMVGDVVRVTDTVGLIEVLIVTLGEGELVKQSVGEPVWVEEGHTDTVLQCVPDTLLHPDKVELAHWLTL
jgi:hypothetical protein